MIFEKLVNLKKDPEKDKRTAEGFTARNKKREETYTKNAKEQAPTEKFYSRSYHL